MGALVAAATAGLGVPGAVAAGTLTPLATELIERAVGEWDAVRARRIQKTLESAHLDTGLPEDQLAEAALSSEAKLNLLVDVLNAAARARLEAKLRLLGHSLATGVLTSDGAV